MGIEVEEENNEAYQKYVELCKKDEKLKKYHLSFDLHRAFLRGDELRAMAGLKQLYPDMKKIPLH